MPAGAMTVAIAAVLAWDCAVAPSPSSPVGSPGSPSSPAPSTPSESTSSPGASGSSAASGSPAVGAVPQLLLFSSSADRNGLWRIDPAAAATLGPGSSRTRIGAPPGTWRPTRPAAGGIMALTAIGESPARIALTRVAGDLLTPIWISTLPRGEPWIAGQAECVSPSGTVAVGDDGLTLYTLDERRVPALVPGQLDNLGECTWLDARTLLWDQEKPEMRAWTIGASRSMSVAIKRFEPSAGGGRLAWFDDQDVTVRVATFGLTVAGVRIGPEVGRVALAPGQHPVDLALSLDGRWLLGVLDDGVSIFPVTDVGLGDPTRIPLDDIGWETSDRITWMPTAP